MQVLCRYGSRWNTLHICLLFNYARYTCINIFIIFFVKSHDLLSNADILWTDLLSNGNNRHKMHVPEDINWKEEWLSISWALWGRYKVINDQVVMYFWRIECTRRVKGNVKTLSTWLYIFHFTVFNLDDEVLWIWKCKESSTSNFDHCFINTVCFF